MTRGRLGKRERQAEQLRKKRMRAASAGLTGAKKPLKAIPQSGLWPGSLLWAAMSLCQPIPTRPSVCSLASPRLRGTDALAPFIRADCHCH
jgi:hypothetical protein